MAETLPETDFPELLRVLTAGGVEFILIGGLAAIAHGSARVTYDLDVIYRRSPENLDRLVRSLAPFNPYLRGAPPGLPFRFDALTLRQGLNFTLTTTLGAIDLLGEIAGGGSYEDLIDRSVDAEILGIRCRVLSLTALIRTKRAAGRPRDFEAIAELEAIAEEREKVR